jgi:hypothetical protein
MNWYHADILLSLSRWKFQSVCWKIEQREKVEDIRLLTVTDNGDIPDLLTAVRTGLLFFPDEGGHMVLPKPRVVSELRGRVSVPQATLQVKKVLEC